MLPSQQVLTFIQHEYTETCLVHLELAAQKDFFIIADDEKDIKIHRRAGAAGEKKYSVPFLVLAFFLAHRL